MWIERLTTSRLLHALELTARFAEERHRILAENVANIDTPDYHTRRLDPAVFQAALAEALTRAESARQQTLELRGNAQVSTTLDGQLQVRPAVEPAENVLFHDGRNASLEKLMTDAQENALTYELVTRLLSRHYHMLHSAIRGRAT